MPHLTTDDGVRLYYEETGTGTPLLRAALSLHRLQRSWLPAFRGAGGPLPLFAGPGARRHSRRARRARDREGPYRRDFDGRLCDVAFRARLSRARIVAGRRRLRLWRRTGERSAIP